jgi:hypothetical protein
MTCMVDLDLQLWGKLANDIMVLMDDTRLLQLFFPNPSSSLIP